MPIIKNGNLVGQGELRHPVRRASTIDILFDVAATLDTENTWWASVPLKALKERMRTDPKPDCAYHSRGRLNEDASCQLALARHWRTVSSITCCPSTSRSCAAKIEETPPQEG